MRVTSEFRKYKKKLLLSRSGSPEYLKGRLLSQAALASNYSRLDSPCRVVLTLLLIFNMGSSHMLNYDCNKLKESFLVLQLLWWLWCTLTLPIDFVLPTNYWQKTRIQKTWSQRNPQSHAEVSLKYLVRVNFIAISKLFGFCRLKTLFGFCRLIFFFGFCRLILIVESIEEGNWGLEIKL